MPILRLITALLLSNFLLLADPPLKPIDAMVGKNLQRPVVIKLGDQAPDDGVDILVRSSDPARLRISKRADQPGSESITIKARQGYLETPEFWLQGLDNSGTVTYTAEAPGFSSGTGIVTLTPSAILIVGPFKTPRFLTTSGAEPSRVTIYSARLDSSLKLAEEQAVAGAPVRVDLISSNQLAGRISESSVSMPPGRSSVLLHFQPSAEGDTVLSLKTSGEFSVPVDYASVTASVKKPGIAITDQLVLGQNLEVGGVLSLGEAAPDQGLSVTLTSEDSTQLLLSRSEDEPGSKSITLSIAGAEASARYYLQGLGNSGTVSYTASAPGFRSRTAIVSLAPSGLILTPASQGPPDEAQVLRAVAPDGVHRFAVDLSKPVSTLLVAWTAQLDPVTHRSADITVQPLRAGLSLTVHLNNSNPAVGQVNSELTFKGGSDHSVVEFKPLSVGSTEITVETPKGFTVSANATKVIGLVRK